MTTFIKNTLRLNLIIFIGFFILHVQGQETTELKGKIRTNSDNISNIHVINLDLEKGSVTDAEGNFQIIAGLNDSLYFSSVQFVNKTIVVTKEIMTSKIVEVELSTEVNELAEVMVDDIKLSGYLANDIGRISVNDVERKFQLQMGLAEAIKFDREQHLYGDPMGGIRLDKIAGTVTDKLSKDRKAVTVYSPKQIANKSIQMVGHQFFSAELGLAENEIYNFVYFCVEDAPRFRNLVLNSNAFVLIEYFQKKIDEFKQRRGDILNAKVQIPG